MPHAWTAEERHMIHIARTEYSISFEDIATLFKHLFADKWENGTTPTHQYLKTEYENRSSAGRPQMWKTTIVKKEDEYTDDEQKARKDVRSDIEVAAEGLGIELLSVRPRSAAAKVDGTSKVNMDVSANARPSQSGPPQGLDPQAYVIAQRVKREAEAERERNAKDKDKDKD